MSISYHLRRLAPTVDGLRDSIRLHSGHLTLRHKARREQTKEPAQE